MPLDRFISAGPSAAAFSSGAAAAPLPAAGSQWPAPSGPGRAGGSGGSSAQPRRQSGGATGRIAIGRSAVSSANPVDTWLWQVVTGPAAHSSDHSTEKHLVSRHVSSEHLNVDKASSGTGCGILWRRIVCGSPTKRHAHLKAWHMVQWAIYIRAESIQDQGCSRWRCRADV